MEFFSNLTDNYEYWVEEPYQDFESYEYRFYDEPINTWWTLITAGFVYIACLGLAIYETGMIRKRNVNAAWLRLVITWFFTFIECWVFTYAFSFGDYSTVYKQKFIGGRNYFAGWNWNSISGTHFAKFWLQAALTTLVNSIIGSFLSDRGRLFPFLIFLCVYTFFFYPAIISWAWGGGWLDQWGFNDYGGSCLIFLNAATSGIAGMLFTGPRYNRRKFYTNAIPEDQKPEKTKKEEPVHAGKIKVMALDDNPHEDSQADKEKNLTTDYIPNTITSLHHEEKKVFTTLTTKENVLPNGLLTMRKLKEIRNLAKYNEDFECIFTQSTFACVGIILFLLGISFLNGFSTRELTSDGWLQVERGIVATLISGATSGFLSFLGYQFVILLVSFRKFVHRNNLIGLCKGVVAGTIAISAGGGDFEPWHAFLIGCFTAILLLLMSKVEHMILLMDDPAGMFCPMLSGGIVGIITMGFVSEDNKGEQIGKNFAGMIIIAGWVLIPSALYWLVFFLLRTCNIRLLRWSFLEEMVGKNHQELFNKYRLKAKISY